MPRVQEKIGMTVCRGLHQMWRVAQKQVPLQRRLRDEAEFAGLEVLQPAVDQPRRCCARARPEIALVHDQAGQALFAQIAEQARPVDPRPEDQHVHIHVARSVHACPSASIRGQSGAIAAPTAQNR